MTHSPLPWGMSGYGKFYGEEVTDASGEAIGSLYMTNGLDEPMHLPFKANADFIVRAVNAHDDLVSALSELWDAVHTSVDCEPSLEARVVAALTNAGVEL